MDKYGKDRVVADCYIRYDGSACRYKDVGRVLDLPYAMVDSIAKMVPREIGITIDKALKMNPDLRAAYESDEQVRDLIDKSKRLEGLAAPCIHARGGRFNQSESG